jgi:hypothetical protein
MHHELSDGMLADETPVFVRYPRTSEEERGDRADWSWLPGTIIDQAVASTARGAHAAL